MYPPTTRVIVGKQPTTKPLFADHAQVHSSNAPPPKEGQPPQVVTGSSRIKLSTSTSTSIRHHINGLYARVYNQNGSLKDHFSILASPWGSVPWVPFHSGYTSPLRELIYLSYSGFPSCNKNIYLQCVYPSVHATIKDKRGQRLKMHSLTKGVHLYAHQRSHSTYMIRAITPFSTNDTHYELVRWKSSLTEISKRKKGSKTIINQSRYHGRCHPLNVLFSQESSGLDVYHHLSTKIRRPLWWQPTKVLPL